MTAPAPAPHWRGVPDHPTWRLLCADASRALPLLPERTFHCLVTSPPYYAFRNYGNVNR